MLWFYQMQKPQKITKFEVKTLFIAFSILTSLAFPLFFNLISQKHIKDNEISSDPVLLLKSSASWSNTSLTIDDEAFSNSSNYGNWKWATDQPWCS
jgi:hypothetical protein